MTCRFLRTAANGIAHCLPTVSALHSRLARPHCLYVTTKPAPTDTTTEHASASATPARRNAHSTARRIACSASGSWGLRDSRPAARSGRRARGSRIGNRYRAYGPEIEGTSVVNPPTATKDSGRAVYAASSANSILSSHLRDGKLLVIAGQCCINKGRAFHSVNSRLIVCTWLNAVSAKPAPVHRTGLPQTRRLSTQPTTKRGASISKPPLHEPQATLDPSGENRTPHAYSSGSL